MKPRLVYLKKSIVMGTQMKWDLFLLILTGIFFFPGCRDRVRSVSGGTTGVLDCGGQRLGDIQLTLHHPKGTSFRPVGFAVTRPDGTFELYAHGATGPLWLSPGKYRCTLESVGAPVQFPKPYRAPETTPLELEWAETMEQLQVNGPTVKFHF